MLSTIGWTSGAVLVIAIVALIYNAPRIIRWWDLRQIAKRPRVPIGEAEAGRVVKLSGVVRHGPETLRAPASGRECAAWTLDVGQLTLNHRGQWRDTAFPVASANKGVRFVIEDESGRAIVEPEGAELLLVEDEKLDHRVSSPEAKEIAERLARDAALTLELRPGGGIMEYAEGVLHEGERVTVVGRARLEDDPTGGAEGGYRGGGRSLVVGAAEGVLLYITDERAVTS